VIIQIVLSQLLQGLEISGPLSSSVLGTYSFFLHIALKNERRRTVSGVEVKTMYGIW